MEKLTEVYVGAISIDGDPETIMIGRHQDNEGRVTMRASVEHTPSALPSLIDFLDAIVEGFASQGHEAKFRLLHFSSEGMEELDPNVYKNLIWTAKVGQGGGS